MEKNEILNLKHNEIIYIKKALKLCYYNKKAAAKKLGISESTLHRKIKVHSIIIK